MSEPSTQRGLYLCTALLLVVSFFICRWLVGSKMGLVLTAVRDREQRLRFLGYPVASYKIFIFAVAAALGGLAGALYVPQVGIITPSQIGVLPSLEIVVWVATRRAQQSHWRDHRRGGHQRGAQRPDGATSRNGGR